MNRAPEVILGGLSCPFVGEINNMTIKSLLESFKEPCVREGQGRLLQIPFTAGVLVQSMNEAQRSVAGAFPFTWIVLAWSKPAVSLYPPWGV